MGVLSIENYGTTLKEIRLSVAMTQTEMSKGIMSQSNYSKVEKNEIDIPFSKMVGLLNRLNMGVDEFIYIHRGYEKDAANHFHPMSKIQTGDKSAVINYIEELTAKEILSSREHELLAIFEAMLLVSENNYEEARKQGAFIWNRLKKHDTWYLYDIQLINSILYIFPIDIAESIVKFATKRLNHYRHLRTVNPLIANLQLNLILMFINSEEYKRALTTVDKLITFCKERNYHTRLAVCYIRKGIILEKLKKKDSSKWFEKGFNFLEFTENALLIEEAKIEIEYATNNKL